MVISTSLNASVGLQAKHHWIPWYFIWYHLTKLSGIKCNIGFPDLSFNIINLLLDSLMLHSISLKSISLNLLWLYAFKSLDSLIFHSMSSLNYCLPWLMFHSGSSIHHCFLWCQIQCHWTQWAKTAMHLWIFWCFIQYHHCIIGLPDVSFNIIELSESRQTCKTTFDDSMMFYSISWIYNWIHWCFLKLSIYKWIIWC